LSEILFKNTLYRGGKKGEEIPGSRVHVLNHITTVERRDRTSAKALR
jgi:hypothetical protein